MGHLPKNVGNFNSSKKPSVESDRQNPQIVCDTTDAVNYLREVRETYLGQREKYDGFITLLREYKYERIDIQGFIARLKELFVGHHNLLLGFNKFLPHGYAITLNDEEVVASDEKKREFEEALAFIEKIKKRFESNDQVYNSFLDHLDAYRYGSKSIDEVCREIISLFKDHPDLLIEFTKYMPED